MALPLAIENLFQIAKSDILKSQLLSGVVGTLIGPGCLIVSLLPVEAENLNRMIFRVAGIIFTVVLVALYFETRTRMQRCDHIIKSISDDPETVINAFRMKNKNSVGYKVHIELVDGSSENFPTNEHDSGVIINYLKARVPDAVDDKIR